MANHRRQQVSLQNRSTARSTYRGPMARACKIAVATADAKRTSRAGPKATSASAWRCLFTPIFRPCQRRKSRRGQARGIAKIRAPRARSEVAQCDTPVGDFRCLSGTLQSGCGRDDGYENGRIFNPKAFGQEKRTTRGQVSRNVETPEPRMIIATFRNAILDIKERRPRAPTETPNGFLPYRSLHLYGGSPHPGLIGKVRRNQEAGALAVTRERPPCNLEDISRRWWPAAWRPTRPECSRPGQRR